MDIQELWKQDFAEKEDASRMRSTEALRILLKKNTESLLTKQNQYSSPVFCFQ